MLEAAKLRFHRILNSILIAVLLGMSGVLYVSAHGGEVTLIHACVSNRNGAVQIVGAGTACDANRETALDWGIQGPQGEKGDPGEVGPMGPQGEQGPAGPGIDRGDTYYVRTSIALAPYQGDGAYAQCEDSNDVLLGGGFSINDAVRVFSSIPTLYFPNPDLAIGAWYVSAFNPSALTSSIGVMAVCLRVDGGMQ